MVSENYLLKAYREYINPNYIDFIEKLGIAHTVQDARGAIIKDSNGKSYIDFIAGYGIFNLGHNPPDLIKALQKELYSSPHWNRPFLNEPLVQLAEKLVEVTPNELDKVFICSTGAEAVDSAIKLARLSTRRSKIVAATGAFHGYSLGALSVCGIPAQRGSFEPLLPDVEFVPFNDRNALKKVVTQETAAVLLEPVQAEIGGESAVKGYLSSARRICDKAGALLIIDEIRTGIGRTGPLFAIEHERIVPDILVIGKSLAGGIVPIGAILAKSNLWGRFGLSFSMSASSFAGNRLACVAGNEILKILKKEEIFENGIQISEILWAGLGDLIKQYPELFQRITGKGLLIGLHFSSAKVANEVIRLSISDGLLVAAAFCNNRCLLIEPPLILKREQAERGLDILKKVFGTVVQIS